MSELGANTQFEWSQQEASDYAFEMQVLKLPSGVVIEINYRENCNRMEPVYLVQQGYLSNKLGTVCGARTLFGVGFLPMLGCPFLHPPPPPKTLSSLSSPFHAVPPYRSPYVKLPIRLLGDGIFISTLQA